MPCILQQDVKALTGVVDCSAIILYESCPISSLINQTSTTANLVDTSEADMRQPRIMARGRCIAPPDCHTYLDTAALLIVSNDVQDRIIKGMSCEIRNK